MKAGALLLPLPWRLTACGLLICLSGCSPGAADSPPSGATRPATAPAAQLNPAASAAEGGAALAPEAPNDAGWQKVELDDRAPLCVMADHRGPLRASFLADVQRQSLRPDRSVVFATFAPGCTHEDCDTGPNLQCWVDMAGPSVLVVHSRLHYAHKPNSTCSQDCRSVVASCESEPLKPGKYTVRYGARSFDLRIPSVLKDPCFVRE